MKQLKKLKEIKGKTISDFTQSNDDLYIKFDDNSFIILTVDDQSEPYGYPQNVIEVDSFDAGEDDQLLVELGIVSKKQFNQAIKKREEREKIFWKEREELERKRIEEEELKILKTLKEKYEKN
jgi:hypothetical protein